MPYESIISPHTEDHNAGAFEAAQRYATDLGIDGGLYELTAQAGSCWVFTDGDPSQIESDARPRIAIRVSTSEKPERLLAKAQHNTLLTQAVRRSRPVGTAASSSGRITTPVQNFVAEPQLYSNFVASASEYLPYGLGSFHDYGVALARLCNASSDHPEITAQARPFNPLAGLQKAYEYLKGHAGSIPHLTREFVDTVVARRLADGNRKVEELRALSEERQRPLSIVQSDVNPNNALRDHAGTTTLIDLDLMQGPAEYCLGRPLGQWSQNFGRPKSWGNDVRRGFEQVSNQPLDLQILGRAIEVSCLEHAASPLRGLVRLIMQGKPPSAWSLQESERRLLHLDVPCRWISRSEYAATQSSGLF